MNKLTLSLILYIIASCNYVFAQTPTADSAQNTPVVNNMIVMFNKNIGELSGLNNGPAFEAYNFRSKTNPNFIDTVSFISGSVYYDGQLYNNVPLIYNLHRDQVVTHLNNSAVVYCLLSEKVNSFSIAGHYFIRLVPNEANKQMATGFYDELYQNNIQLLARRTKNIQELSTSLANKGNIFVQNNDYYLKKGDLYYNVNSQGRFLDVLKDKKKELKQYIKEHNMRFGDNPEHTMQVLAAYYESLTK